MWPILSQYRNIYVHPNNSAKETIQKSVLYPYRRDRKRMRCKKKQVLTKCKLREVKIRSVHRIMYAAAKLEGPEIQVNFRVVCCSIGSDRKYTYFVRTVL